MQDARGRKQRAEGKLSLLCLSLLCLSLLSPLSAGALAAESGPGVRLLRSDEQGIVLELHTPDYELKEQMAKGMACQRIRVPGYAQSEEAGRPQLPLQVVLLGVPPEAELELDVTPLQTARVPGHFAICPAAEAVVEQGENGLIRYVMKEADPDPAVYNVDSFYPPEVARLDDLGFVRSQRVVRLEIFPFQIHPLSGELRHHRHLRLTLRFRGGERAASPVAEPKEFEVPLKRVLLNHESARAWRGKPMQAMADPLPNPSPTRGRAGWGWTPPQPGYKIMVREEGIYELSQAALAAAGMPVETLDPRTLRLFNAGQEVAIHVTGEEDGRFDEGDVVLFYGQGVDTRYTDTNVYWLTYGGATGLRMAEKPSLPGGVEPASFLASVHLEENRTYVSSLPMEEGVDHWYGLRIQAAGLGNPGWQDFPFTASHVATGTFTATLEVALAGNVEGTHHLRLYVNGHQVHDDHWSGRTLYHARVDFPQSHLSEGNNVIRVELANDTPGQFFDMVYTDWLRVGYQRSYVAEGDELAFGGDEAGTWQYRVSGFSSEDIELFDVTDPARVSRIVGAVISEGGVTALTPAPHLPPPLPKLGEGEGAQGEGERASYTLRFGDSHDGARRYLALTAARRLTPLSIELDNPSELQSPDEGADYIIVTHGDFREAVQPLAAHRAAQGLRVQVVDVQDIYDEFGYGLMSAEAIRDFLAYAYSHWPEPAPSYVLLVGDGTYDFRHYLSTSAPTYIPPYLKLVDQDLGETAADNRYACVSGNDFLPDLHIGRLPANTPAEAEVMVNKILSYETSPAEGDWNRHVLFVTDDLEGGGGDFYAFSDSIADGYADPPTNTVKLLPEPYTATKIYLGRTCPDENPSVICQQEIVDTLNTTGALLVSYIGHATKTYWAEERLMDLAALTRLTNGDKLPIALPMTCHEGYFHEAEAGFEAFGEANVRTAGGGAVASWSPTGFGLAAGHDYLERGLFLALFHDGVQELGAATTQAKLYLLAHAPAGRYDDLLDTFLLFGDPALRVRLAEPEKKVMFVPLLMRAHEK